MCLGLCCEVYIQVYALPFQSFMPYNDLLVPFKVYGGGQNK